MAVVLASVIAVLGTLAGTTTGYVLQRRMSEHNEIVAREERLRQERMIACSAFAGAVMDLRRVQYDRWYRREEDPQQMVPEDIRNESYRLRSAAWSAFYRFRLTTTDAELTRLAWTAVDAAADVDHATDRDNLRERGDRARTLLEEFVAAAALQFDGNVSQAM
jgi:hypothetical protein